MNTLPLFRSSLRASFPNSGRWRHFAFLTLLTWTVASSIGGSRAEAVEIDGKLAVVKITDRTVTDSSELYQLSQVLTKIGESKASAVAFDINTEYGDAAAVAKFVRENVANFEKPVFAWANPSATGAGAVLALGADTIFMSPLGTLGGIGVSKARNDDDDDEPKSDRATESRSTLSAAVRAIAEAKGHDLKIASAFVDPNIELEELVDSKSVLTLTTSQATANGFAESVSSMDDVASAAKLDPVTISDWRSFLRDADIAAQDVEQNTGDSGIASKESGSKKLHGDSLFSKAQEDSFAGKIVVIEIVESDELLLKSRFAWFERAIQKASDDGASAVILDMNTPVAASGKHRT